MGFSESLWYQVYQTMSSGIQGGDELSHFVNVLVFIIFHAFVKYISQELYCTYSKGRFSVTHCGISLYSFSFA